jgi:erythromycin esterase
MKCSRQATVLTTLCFALVGSWACSEVTDPRPGVIIEPTDPDRLFSDGDLNTPPDQGAQPAEPEWVRWLEDHHHPIRSLTSSDYSDLRFLESQLEGKRIVQLGESAHGVAEYNQLKVRLIRYLHEELGYSVLAFESPIYECSVANTVALLDELLQCPFPVWHTREGLPLFEWLTEQRQGGAAPPLRLAGFDMQVIGFSILDERPARLAELARFVGDDAYARAVFVMDSALVDGYRTASLTDWLLPLRDSLRAAYTSLGDRLSAASDALDVEYAHMREWPVIAIRTAYSMAAYVHRYLRTDTHEATVLRDSIMAENLETLLDLHPDEKFIVWAHNVHIRHDNAAIGASGVPTMGSWLSARHRDELYTIGFYMYRGMAAFNNRQVYTLLRPQQNSLENIAYHIRKKHIFFDISGAEQEPGSQWLFQSTVTKAWGLEDVPMVLRHQYDGIVYIDEVSAPAYLPLPWEN